MARPLDTVEVVDPTTEAAPQSQARLTRTTARAFAAAVAALLIATLVVNRSNDALTAEGTAAAAALSSGTISLVDDDQGRSLFDLGAMAPGRPVLRCLEVVYDGTILPVELAMRSESTGTLTSFLDVSVEEGTGGTFEDCDGFRPTRPVFAGTLAELTDTGWIPLGRMVNSGDTRTYRVRIELQDTDDALGQSARAEFLWEATPA